MRNPKFEELRDNSMVSTPRYPELGVAETELNQEPTLTRNVFGMKK